MPSFNPLDISDRLGSCTNEEDDKKYRSTPEDGHVLLLMEPKAGERTFSDYPTLAVCIETVIVLYEQTRIAKNQRTDDYIIEDLWTWLDGFCRVEMFVFDKEIARYKRNLLDEFKELMVQQMKKLDEAPPMPITNGHSNGISTAQENGDDFVEDWDDD